MKTKKVIFFVIDNHSVEELEADEANISDVVTLKTQLAAAHGVSFDDVEAIAKDVLVPELSEALSVREDGVMVRRGRPNSFFIPVNGVRPAMDISHEELFYEFLDHITKKEFDNALIFN
jgi:hypothetical protein